jgi:hypothetical protein
LIHAQIELEKGDLKVARSLLNLLPTDYDPDGATTWTRINLALCERDIDGAASVLASWKKEELVGAAGQLVPVSFWQGLIARARGDGAKAGEAFTSARATVTAQLAEQPDEPMLLATLGLVDAGLSRKEEALREGRRAVELRSLTEDAVDGATVLSFLAMIHAWVGDAKSSLDRLESVARIPSGISFGQLKYDPAWDAVRGDARFTAILNELQPKAKGTR